MKVKNSVWLAFAGVLIVVGSFACKKKTGDTPDFYYNYYPTSIGTYVEYTVDSMYHDNASDTFQFQVREVVADEFLDNEGRNSVRIERFKRPDNTVAWALTDVWFATRTSTRLEKIEEDVRFVKMLFPPKRNDRWDGNLYNIHDEEEYQNVEVHIDGNYGGFAFDSLVVVEQEDRQNLVDTVYKEEVFASGVGLVSKTYRDLFYVWDSVGNQSVLGSEYYQTVIGYGPQ